MRTFAKSTFVGYLGRDAESKMTQGGKPVVSLSVAVDSNWNKETRRFDSVNFFRIVVYGERNCDFAKDLRKGDPVYVEAEIRQRQYEKDGVTRDITEYVVSEYRGDVNVLSSPRDRAVRQVMAHSQETGRTTRTLSEEPPF